MTAQMTDIPPGVLADAEVLFDFNQMHHELHPCDIGIGLGSHDPNVPEYTAELYHRGMFPRIVFTGANAPTTIGRFPRGEAVHFREIAIAHGVPPDAILTETESRYTIENVTLTRELLTAHDIHPKSAVVISRPYQQRRAFAIFQEHWPELAVICTSRPLPLADYVYTIGDPKFVIDMIVGDTQRVIEHHAVGFTEVQGERSAVTGAYARLVDAGFQSRLSRS